LGKYQLLKEDHVTYSYGATVTLYSSVTDLKYITMYTAILLQYAYKI